jgi:hypothetical protein
MKRTRKSKNKECGELVTVGLQITKLSGKRSLGAWRYTHSIVHLHDCGISFSLWASDQVPMIGLKKSQVLRSVREAKKNAKIGRAKDGLGKNTCWQTRKSIHPESRDKWKGGTQITRPNGRRSLGAWRCNYSFVNVHDCILTFVFWVTVLRSMREAMSSLAQRVLRKLHFVEKATDKNKVKIKYCAAESGHSAVRDTKHR